MVVPEQAMQGDRHRSQVVWRELRRVVLGQEGTQVELKRYPVMQEVQEVSAPTQLEQGEIQF